MSKTESTTHYIEINTHHGIRPRRTWYSLTCCNCGREGRLP